MQPLINKIKVSYPILIPFVSDPLKLFQCQIVVFALFFTIIHKLTKEKKIVLLKTNTFSTAPTIVDNSDAIQPQVTFVAQDCATKVS